MATIQQSIDVKVPVHAAYDQLIHFEDYPLFMDEVKTVQQLDDRHLHWTTVMANRPVEWDAEITEREPGRCIAWHNISGPTNAGRVELQPVGQDAARVVFTLQAEPEQVPGSMAGSSEQETALRLKLDLARMKDFIEAGGAAAGVPQRAGGDSAGQRQGLAESTQGERGSPRNSPVPMSAYAAGSEGFCGDEDMSAPVTSAARTAAEQRNDAAGSSVPPAAAVPDAGQPGAMRHLGQMPQDTSAERHGGMPTSDAMGKRMSPVQQPAPGSADMPVNAQPGHSPHPAAAHAAGATDAEAGARLSGSHAGSAQQKPDATGAAAPAGPSEAAGAGAAGGAGLGTANSGADAGDTRSVPRAGTTGAAGGTSGGGSAKP